MKDLSVLPLANNRDQWSQFLVNGDKRFVRSLETFDRLVGGDKEFVLDRESIFGSVDAQTIAKFRESLLFKDGGLAHAGYDMLIDRLTYAQFARLWAAFGFSMNYFVDHKDKYCASKSTCERWDSKICTSSC